MNSLRVSMGRLAALAFIAWQVVARDPALLPSPDPLRSTTVILEEAFLHSRLA